MLLGTNPVTSILSLQKQRKRGVSDTDDLEKMLLREYQAIEVYSCLFCKKWKEESELHQVSILNADSNT